MKRALVRAGGVSRRGALLGSLALGVGVTGAPAAPPLSPAASSDPVWLDAAGEPLPFRSEAEIVEFLRSAPVVRSEPAAHGRFGVRKARLELDGLAVHAAVRTYVEEAREARVEGRLVRHFRDHFIHEPAAYDLSELLELHMVPPAVARSVDGEPASVQIWVEASTPLVEMEELVPPQPERYAMQMSLMRVFDNLTHNIDRNQGNILIGDDWRVWLIDHTRAFNRSPFLPDPDSVQRIGRRLWERLRSVSDDELDECLEPYLPSLARLGLRERRRALVELIEERIARFGESAIVVDLDDVGLHGRGASVGLRGPEAGSSARPPDVRPPLTP